MKKKQTSRTSPTNGGTTQTKTKPTIFEYSSMTHQRTLAAKGMRKGLRKSLPELASMLGYSPSQVLAFERGYDKDGKALPDKKWRRYLFALIGASYAEEKWENAQGHARVQAWRLATGNGEAGEKGRQGHRPQASDRHRFERGEEGGGGVRDQVAEWGRKNFLKGFKF